MPLRNTLLFIFLLGFNFCDAQSEAVEECEYLLSQDELSSADFHILDSLIFGMNYYDSDMPRQLYLRARAKAFELGLPEVYLNFDIWLADLFYETDERDSCKHYAIRAAKLSKEFGLDLIYAKSANIRRLLLTGENNFTEAYEACFEALEIFENISNLDGMGVANRDIGSIKLLEKKYVDALAYCKKSEKFLLQSQNWYELTYTFQRLGIIYRSMGDFDLAHEYILK